VQTAKLFAVLVDVNLPVEFLSDGERHQKVDDRDPFAGWRE